MTANIHDEGTMLSLDSGLAERRGRTLAVPAELKAFSEPLVLPGESSRDFEIIRQMMIDDIQPRTNIEWLWTLDVVETSWEILRYRQLKKRVLDTHRTAAIHAILRRLDGEGMPPEAAPMVATSARRAAADGAMIQRSRGTSKRVYAETDTKA